MLLLNERSPSEPLTLTAAQQNGLRKWFRAKLEPTVDGRVIVVPGDCVGTVRIDGLDIVVRPKLPVTRLLTLIAEAADPYRWIGLDVEGLESHSLADSVAALFARACLLTFEQGVLQDYRREDQQLPFVRGRMRIPEYARSPMPLPIPVTAGVFDSDNPENQILRAALDRVRTSPAVTEVTRVAAQRAWRSVAHTSVLRDPIATAASISWNRRNHYYRATVSLARMILAAGTGANLRDQGESQGIPGFVLYMPNVIEQWVRAHLRKHWNISEVEMRDSWDGYLWLDEGKKVKLKPDLGVRVNGDWQFIGEIKYKDFFRGRPESADVYQLVSYLAATGVRSGTLIYAGTAGEDLFLHVRLAGMDLRVITVNLSSANPSAELTAKIGRLVLA